MDELSGFAARVPGFEFNEILGSGATSTVLRATDSAGRSVAVKIFSEQVRTSNAFKKLASREIAALQKIKGERVAKVLEAHLDKEFPYIVMELVRGKSLSATVEKGPLSGGVLQTAIESLTEAVSDVHAAGVIHRDLKPANVLFGEDGIRLVDFGISASEDVASHSMTSFSGTPGWTSPEQAVGQVVGPESDVFNLGLLIAYAATGRHPFGEGRPDAMLFRIVNSEPQLDEVPELYRHIVEACLQKSPSARPTTGQILEVLRERTGSSVGDEATRLASRTLLIQNANAGSRRGKTSPPVRKKSRRLIIVGGSAVLTIAGTLLAGFLAPAEGPVRVVFEDKATSSNPALSETNLRVRSGATDPSFYSLASGTNPSSIESALVGEWEKGQELAISLTPGFNGDRPLSLNLESVGSGFFTQNAELMIEIERNDLEVTVKVTNPPGLFGLFPGRNIADEEVARGNEKRYLAEQEAGLDSCVSDVSGTWRTELEPLIEMSDDYQDYYSGTRFYDGVTLLNNVWAAEAGRIADHVFSLNLAALPFSPDQRESRGEPYPDSVVTAGRAVFTAASQLTDAWENFSYQMSVDNREGDLRDLQPRAWLLIDTAGSALRSASNSVSTQVRVEARQICGAQWPDGQ